jgi:Na+/H+ antiporter NhaD/arsenite permease-like protein
MEKKYGGLYHALVVFPDHVYPFKTEVEGQWVRGVRSYNATLARYQQKYGDGRYGFRLDAYRQLFHLAGSILFLVSAAYLSQMFFGSTVALYAFLIAAVLFISFQEFYLQRRTYRQLWRKGILDWLTWCVPIGLYFLSTVR